MKLAIFWKNVIFITTVFFAGAVLAVTPDEEDKKECKKPKFRDFAPAHKAEVAPETPISFHVNRPADPNHIKLEAKGINVPVTVIDKVTYWFVNAKLPAEIRDGFARIHVTAKALDGECIGSDGWLIKIKTVETPNQTEPPK
ncbi:MAG: hypothetical protein ABSB19_01130 [Methylomonas sp.]|jgi:hypothetical protein